MEHRESGTGGRLAPDAHRWPVGALAVGVLAVLASAAAWGTSRLLSPDAPVERSARVTLPDLPERMPASLVPVLTQADAALRRAIAEDAGAAAVGRAAGRLGQLYQANLDGVRAAQCYDLALTRVADNPRWTYLLALVRQEHGESASVTELLERTVELAPEYSPAWLKLADNQFKQGLADRARLSYDRRLELSPDDPYARLGLARLALDRSEWEVAERHLSRVSAGEAFDAVYRLLASVHAHFGRSRRQQDALARAEAAPRFAPAPDPWFDELVRQSHDVAWLLLNVSRYASAGQGPTAQRILERARRLAPNDPEVYVAFGRYTADLTQARQALEKAVALAPDHAAAHVSLGEMLLRENRPRDAEVVLRKAIAIDPDVAAAHKNLGLAVAAAGRFQEALEHARRARAISPNTVSLHYALASILRQAGRRDEARQEFRRILERWPSHPGATQALAALADDG